MIKQMKATTGRASSNIEPFKGFGCDMRCWPGVKINQYEEDTKWDDTPCPHCPGLGKSNGEKER